MGHDEIQARLRAVIAEVFETTPDALPVGADTDSVEKWDSLGHLMLIESLEEAFDVTFGHAETIEMLSEADLLERLAARISADRVIANSA